MAPDDAPKNLTWRPLFCFALLVAATLMGAVSSAEPSEDETRPQGVDCVGFQRLEGVGPVCPVPHGLWEVYAEDGTPLGYTHGTDPVPAPRSDEEAEALTAPVQPPKCTADPANDYYAVVIYAVAHDGFDRYPGIIDDLRDEVIKANTHLRIDAGEFDVQADYKVLCSGGEIDVKYEVLPTPRASASFSTIVNDLRNLGYDDNQRKYWVFYDDRGACTCGGTGHIYNDDRLTTNNLNNGYHRAIPMFGVTFGYMDYPIMMHENGHNMGAVQRSAPHSTAGRHCIDGNDIMCYDDGSARSEQYSSTVCAREAFDCNHDDYFNPKPEAGSYLADHWNVGSTLNRFLAFGTCGLAREGNIPLPGNGVYVPLVTGAEETDIPATCGGRPFVLHSTHPSGDFDVCFYGETSIGPAPIDHLLECHDAVGDEAGTIPVGTTKAQITLKAGFGPLEQYTLITP